MRRPTPANFKPRDKELLAKVRLRQGPGRRAVPPRHRRLSPQGSARLDRGRFRQPLSLSTCQKDGKAIRYGITVGEEAMAWSGIAKVGSKTEWPPWHPTPGEISRLGVPTFVAPGPDNPMGSRALYLYSGGKDTLFRIHGTNQPEYIGASISSGCIRMTNEDVIDLYDRVELGTVVVVLEPKHGDSPFNSQMALQGGGNADDAVTVAHRDRDDQKRRFCRRFFVARLGWLRLGLGARICRAGLRRTSPARICVRLAGFGSGAVGFGGDLARRRLLRPLGRQQRRDLRQRIPHVPLADPVVVAPLHQVEMDVVLVVPVRARPQHGRKPRADRMQHVLAHLARHGAVGQRDRLAVGELEGADVERVGAAVFGQLGAGDAVAAAAFERVEIVEIADRRCRGSRASGAMSVRIQSAIADAMAQRRIAAGFTATCRLSGSTIASSRTRSSPPQPPGPWMSGMLGAMAISSVSASRQAEGWRRGRRACSAGLSVSAGVRFAAGGLLGLGCRRLGRARLRQRHRRAVQRCPARPWRGPSRTGRPTAPARTAPRRRRRLGLRARTSAAAAAAVTIGRSPCGQSAPQAHLRLAFSALKFMSIP